MEFYALLTLMCTMEEPKIKIKIIVPIYFELWLCANVTLNSVT